MSDTVAKPRDISRVEFIILVAALMALNALAIDVMLPALPYMGEALGVSNENERQLVIGSYMFGFGIAQLAFGPLTDRFGRRGPLFVGLAIYLVCAFAAIFAPTFGILLALRFVQGMGAAGTRVIATAVVRDRFEGRGGVAAYGRALESDSLSRLALEADLRNAFVRGEIEPFYQPVVNLLTGAVAGFEALARWRHPKRGLVPPDEFLGLADEMGLMNDLGLLMMTSASRQLAEWLTRHPSAGKLFCSVNLSVGEIERPNLVEDVTRIIADAGLPKGALKLEVTEGDIMRDTTRAAETLTRLREAGASLALDDFGTGFSSLTWLAKLPFDTLKIDRYFVLTMDKDEGSAKIVKSVVNLGRDLSLEVVAEGVENAGLAKLLLDAQCHYGQGFGYAPALPAQEAEVYLNESLADGTAPIKARSA